MPNHNNDLHAYIPDGYTPNGKTRPWRQVLVMSVKGKFASVFCCDTGERLTVPCAAIRYRREGNSDHA